MMAADPVHDHESASGLVMVGVDGSPASVHALVWAFDEAHRRDAHVEAVYVYAVPTQSDWYVGGHPGPLPPDDATVVQSARQELERAVARAIPEMSAVCLTTLVVPDSSAARGLTHAAVRADLLVVGAHHVNGFGRLFGSTTAGVLRHAPCPVVVVPGSQRVEADEGHDALVTA